MYSNTFNLDFFLGGQDLEMQTISELLKQNGLSFHDRKLSWGAKASSYEPGIKTALKKGKKVILVELEDDLGLGEKVISIDHHGKRAGRDEPTSLHQVFYLLKRPPNEWSRWFSLVAANDRGYIPAMLEIDATLDEMQKIRAADRQAQGVTPTDEEEAEQALSDIKTLANGRLTLATLPHNKTSAICDRLEPSLGGKGYENLVVLCPTEINFFGKGRIVGLLKDTYLDSWYGGALEKNAAGRITGGYGFWGMHNKPEAMRKKVVSLLENNLQVKNSVDY